MIQSVSIAEVPFMQVVKIITEHMMHAPRHKACVPLRREQDAATQWRAYRAFGGVGGAILECYVALAALARHAPGFERPCRQPAQPPAAGGWRLLRGSLLAWAHFAPGAGH